MDMSFTVVFLLLGAGFWAGAQNALAGGGSFITLPILMFSGLDARIANLTSTVALFPGQVVAGLRGRQLITDTGGLPLPLLVVVNIAGGAAGALVLLATPSHVFARLIPWLMLFATLLFTWSNFGPRQKKQARRLNPVLLLCMQLGIGFYGGYFGGGNGMLMLATLSLAGLDTRSSGALKNMLVFVINGVAALIFGFSSEAVLGKAVLVGTGALIGGIAGVWMLQRVNEKVLRMLVILIGIALTVWLFATA